MNLLTNSRCQIKYNLGINRIPCSFCANVCIIGFLRPERFNLQKAWRRQRKQDKLEKENKTDQELEAYTAPPIVGEGPVEISPRGLSGAVTRETETTTDWTLIKGDTYDSTDSQDLADMDEKLHQFRLLANATRSDDDDESDEDDDDDYSFY